MEDQQAIILIVDDNPNNIKVLFEVLEQANFCVLISKNGESALEKVAAVTPDLILLDVMMPGIDGFETCR
ncbi:MAG: response regulator, partial [Phormidesmis sp. CAN_BIN36]|nr:response regulator [Phormidesmis sp. CAN_BIN36]